MKGWHVTALTRFDTVSTNANIGCCLYGADIWRPSLMTKGGEGAPVIIFASASALSNSWVPHDHAPRNNSARARDTNGCLSSQGTHKNCSLPFGVPLPQKRVASKKRHHQTASKSRILAANRSTEARCLDHRRHVPRGRSLPGIPS